MALWVSRLFFILPLFSLISCRPPQLQVPLALYFSFYLVSLYFVFYWIFICPFSVGSFSGVFLLPSHSWARCISVLSCFFQLVQRGSRVQSSGFRLYCSLTSWIRLVHLLCVSAMVPQLPPIPSGLVMFLQLSPVLSGLVMLPLFRPLLNLKTLLRRLPFP